MTFALSMRFLKKSTQLIEYYWDCIPVIGLRPESVHTRNGLGANSYAKVHIFSRLAKSDFAQKRSVASLSEFLYYLNSATLFLVRYFFILK